ncbi:MAG: hypothetical protein RL885_25590 [Planctomycetota bacterium]
MHGLLLLAASFLGCQDSNPIDAALEAFAGARPEQQEAILAQIVEKIEASEDPELRKILDLRDQARKKLKIEEALEPRYYDPKVYARGLVERSWAPLDDRQHLFLETIFAPVKNEQPIYLAVEYDFARNLGARRPAPVSPRDRLWNYLNGYPPDSDLLVAYLTARLDFDDDYDLLADHFSHAYSDLEAKAYSKVELYDAFASTEHIDMPDVDVIAFARRILKDRSYVSPLPANSKREKLYDEVKKRFLEYYQYRTWIEEAAVLYLNPWAELRSEHEPIRERLIYAIALEGEDLEDLRKRFEKAKDRDVFIKQIDKAYLEDDEYKLRIAELRKLRSQALWATAIATQGVLKEHGYLKD